jgi:hypothetical protein
MLEMMELDGHNKEIEDRIFRKYRDLRVEKKELCDKCNPPRDVNGGLPVSFFVVGEDFPKQQTKLMFVGKTVQSGWDEGQEHHKDEASGFIDARGYAKKALFLPSWSTYPFWQCIKEICQTLWNTNDLEQIWRRITITNLVKCSTSPERDTTPHLLKENCINLAGFFENEVKIAQPTHIILFTGLNYDENLEKVTFGYDFVNVEKTLDIGVASWKRDFLEDGKVKMRFLRTYHPGYFKTQEEKWQFCQFIVDWIDQSPILP